ncbi:uncharacterized protein LOC130690931 [Daphnia carinata]|uniref:uncharacterized protein LOC130690931 n=1 Tax=Daphnia carinata TaxID=120202 RepID=UPI00257C3747|nr:uncharacterized protein LOC130690931 [Daphnia carinata]XP_057369787.1 uncharacterized protein LOC130690931 [Daphnia carinata]
MSRDATAVIKARVSRSPFTLAIGAKRRTMSYRLTVALFFLVSGLWPQMVTSAPTPQQEEGGALAGLLDADSVVSAGRDDGKSDEATEFRYGGWWNEGEPAKPPDIRARNQHPTGPKSPPEIHIIDNVNLLFTSFQDHAQHASSTTTSNTSSLSTPSPPAPTRTITPRSVDQDDQTNFVFNIVIQKEKTQKSAFIAPDVTWLRDLVPKVVDVVDKPDTAIKETIFSVMDKQSTDEDRQILVNVVKAQVDSEEEVPQILARLRNLMQTGEGVDLALVRNSSQSQYQPVIINVVIVNVLSVNVVNVIIPDPTLNLNSSEQARTPDSTIDEDSYIEALRESQRNRNKESTLTMNPPHPHQPDEKHQPHHGPHVISPVATTQQQFNGFYLTEVPTQGYVSTGRPLMAMEKEYLRSYDVELPKQQSDNMADKQERPESEPLIDRKVGAVKSPTGPYFTNIADKPAKIEILDVNKVAKTNVRETPKPENRPLKVRAPGALSTMTNKATSAVRNQIRTIGFVAIPMLAGLASTVNAWLPAMAQLGRRRKKRSMEYEQYEEDWQPNPKFVGTDDRRRAIQDAQVLALLMGKRYMNVSKESLQESIDNWKNRDQEAAAAIPPHTTDPNKLASTNRPLWFQFQRTNNSSAAESTVIPPTTTVAPSTVNRPIYYEEDTQTNNNENHSPLFYSAASALDDILENREMVEYYDDTGPSTSSSGSTSTEAADYEEKETQSEENVAMAYQEPVTPHIHILPDTSPSGDDFDIVANFVQAMMMNGNNKNIPPVNGPENREDMDGPEHREDIDGPEHREDIYGPEIIEDGPEHRENIFFVKAPSIVNTTKTTGPTTTKPTTGATRVPPIGSGSTLSLFAADPIMPNWTNTNDRVTNSPVTYVAIRAPPVQPSLSRFPSQSTTTTTQSYDYDIANVNDSNDPMSNEQMSTPLQFHEDDSGITFFVSKDVPSRITSTASSTSGLTETKPTSTGRPLSQWFSDPFENGLFVGSGTTNTIRPASSSTTSSFPTQPATRPSSATSSFQSTAQPTILPTSSTSITQSTYPPGTRPTSPTFNSQSSTSIRPTTSNFNPQSSSPSASRPTTSNSQPSSPSTIRPTTSMFNSQSVTRPVGPPLKLQSISQFGNRPSASVSAKPQAGRPSSLLTMASFTAPPRQKPAVPPPVEVSNGMSKYTKVPSAVTTPPVQDLSTLTGDSALVSATVEKNNILAGIVKGAALTSPLPQQSTGQPTTTMAETSDVNQLFGGYSSTSSTSRPVSTTGVSSEELDSTLDNLVTQLEIEASGLVSTKRPIGGLHFINTSTDVVIINPYDVTPSSIFSPLQMESGEAEMDDETNESSDSIVVDAEAGNQPDSVPVVSNLANFLFASSGSSSSGSSGSSASNDGTVSGAGVTSSTSASSVDPFALFYTLGLASAGILALTLPIWVPLVVAKKKRRTGSYGPIKNKEKKKKNQYPAKKKKTSGYAQKKPTYGEPPPNHYKDLDEDLPYHEDDYPAVPPNHPTYHSTTVEDLYRSGVNQDYADTDVDHYSTLYRDLFSSNSDDAFHDAGPLNSEDVYGPSTSTYYDGKKAARRRRSIASNKRFH